MHVSHGLDSVVEPFAAEDHQLLARLTAACPEMTQLTACIRGLRSAPDASRSKYEGARAGEPRSAQPICVISTPSSAAWNEISTL